MAKKTFDKKLGVIPVNSKKGYCKLKLKIKPEHLNQGSIVHGGVLATLCDIALAGSLNNSLQKNEWCVTAELNIYFLSPAFPKDILFAYGKLIRRGNTLAFVEGDIETKDKRKIASAQGIWVIKSKFSKRVKKVKGQIKALS